MSKTTTSSHFRWPVATVATVSAAVAVGALTLGSLREVSPFRASPERPRPAISARAIQPGFACGTLVCDPGTTYCETINTDVPALPSNHACRPLPSACMPQADGAARDCECFPPRTRGDYCSAPILDRTRVFYRTSIGGH